MIYLMQPDQATDFTPQLSVASSPRPVVHQLRWIPSPQVVAAVRGYALAVLSAAAAVVAIHTLRNPIFPTPLFFASIVISTWYGGILPGVLAVGLATVALDYYFIEPLYSLTPHKPELPYLLEFALPALLTCWFVRKRRITEQALRRSRDELADRVQERQAELARVSRDDHRRGRCLCFS